jgi:histidinol-phosphate aminotransferase
MRPNPGIEKIRPYEGGKPIEEVRRELGLTDVVKMASNENPLGPSPQAVTAMREAAARVHLYPDGNAYYLRQDLARHLDVRPEELILGNGSNDVLQIVGETFIAPGSHVVYPERAFVIYHLVSTLLAARVTRPPMRDYRYDLPALADAVTPETRVVFVANPNNPTGTYVTKAELDAFFERVPDSVLVVLDEAYFEYAEAPDYPNGLEYLRAGRNVIVTRTFSKIHGLAGLRIGYGVARPEVIEWMNRARQPFNVNSLAQAAARAALADFGHVEKSRALNRAGMEYLTGALSALGVTCVPSVANFVLVLLQRDGAAVSQALMRRGVIVRPMAGYDLPHAIRVTVGLPSENKRFMVALQEALKEAPRTG